MEDNTLYLIWLLVLCLRVIARIHNSQGNVNRMAYVILLTKGNKAPLSVRSSLSFTLQGYSPFTLRGQTHCEASAGLFDSELTISIQTL